MRFPPMPGWLAGPTPYCTGLCHRAQTSLPLSECGGIRSTQYLFACHWKQQAGRSWHLAHDSDTHFACLAHQKRVQASLDNFTTPGPAGNIAVE